MNDKLAKKTVKKFSSFSRQGVGTKKLKKCILPECAFSAVWMHERDIVFDIISI